MREREDLEKRVAELEKRVAAHETGFRAVPIRGVRKRADWNIGGLPFYDIALGPDLEHGELRGRAKGVIAVGDIATGFLAIGGLARGVIAIGGLAAGLLGLGGLSVGILAAVGGLAIGGVAIGGGAVGAVALGGGAIGYYACGGGAAGVHASSAARLDREADAFFARYGLESVCRGRGR